uniref:Uncharacterized protein n=1 Tax=Nothoprocta perdicaria TaxID=30464 RepID=A0A8C7ED33_NOTPE
AHPGDANDTGGLQAGTGATPLPTAPHANPMFALKLLVEEQFYQQSLEFQAPSSQEAVLGQTGMFLAPEPLSGAFPSETQITGKCHLEMKICVLKMVTWSLLRLWDKKYSPHLGHGDSPGWLCGTRCRSGPADTVCLTPARALQCICK